MQTFLPYPDFTATAECLDRQRLGKQRVECKQILNALLNGGGWSNHPATKMWAGYEHSLVQYAIAICTEWRARGYNDSLLEYFNNADTTLRQTSDTYKASIARTPPWLGDTRLHSSHRAALLHKNEDHYCEFVWNEEPELDYFWPVQRNQDEIL